LTPKQIGLVKGKADIEGVNGGGSHMVSYWYFVSEILKATTKAYWRFYNGVYKKLEKGILELLLG
jgi:hypothetical protein